MSLPLCCPESKKKNPESLESAVFSPLSGFHSVPLAGKKAIYTAVKCIKKYAFLLINNVHQNTLL